ncbi:MAG: single-strand DNA-binding protein [Frankiaceae bacterium]|jgi:single-strand DNA-binding protein|nr:single-strand DNA-binding protein [Frankiaceae bacterium]MDX6224325.1 single-strand DNA-binding protein [Frankiales bacterium]MDX6273766.1 single-strand DNA-binding protein [Frankiales bacterium]
MAAETAETEHHNEVRLVGRVAAEALERELPSGDVLVQLRLVVRRRAHRGTPPRQPIDTLDCVAWLAAPRRSLLSLDPGDTVEITGELRRRFWGGASGSSRYEVEVHKAKRLARASQLSA